MPLRRLHRVVLGLAVGLASLAGAGCDAVMPEEDPRLVVEGFLDAGKPFPPVRLRQTRGLDEPYPLDGGGAAVTDAQVQLILRDETSEERRIAYAPAPEAPGQYRPRVEGVVAPGMTFEFEAVWRGQRARAVDVVPPPIRLDSVSVRVPERPVLSVLFDSLFVNPTVLDSLRLDSLRVGAEVGYAYPVEVTLWWRADPADTAGRWVRTQLQPRIARSSRLDDFFLRPEEVQPEAGTALPDASERHAWTGVYGVSVEAEADPLPAHTLRVAVVRSGPDYARFASTRSDPESREPVSNVEGAVGIVAGVAVDSVRVAVP